MTFEDRARAEAEKRWPPSESEYLNALAIGFVIGAEWARGQDPTEAPKHRGDLGCCPDCDGAGRSTEPELSGYCWTCRGTGHDHAEDMPC